MATSANDPIHFVNEYKPPIPPDMEAEMNPPLTLERIAATRLMTPAERLAKSFELSKRFTDRIKADILAEHPDWSPVQRHRAFLDYMLGPDALPADLDLSRLACFCSSDLSVDAKQRDD